MSTSRIRAAAAVAAAALTLAAPAGAQQERGDKELGIGGNLRFTQPDEGRSTTSGTVFGSLGVFTTRNLKISAGLGVNLTASEGETQSFGMANYGAYYYFGGRGAKTYPYLGAGASTAFSSSEGARSSTDFAGYAGIQHFINRQASFFAQTSYTPRQGSVDIPVDFGFRVVF